MEMPRVILGLGSASEAAWAFPLRAKMAEGFPLERLGRMSVKAKYEGGRTRRGVGRVFLAIGSKSLRRSREAAQLAISIKGRFSNTKDYFLGVEKRRCGLCLEHRQVRK